MYPALHSRPHDHHEGPAQEHLSLYKCHNLDFRYPTIALRNLLTQLAGPVRLFNLESDIESVESL